MRVVKYRFGAQGRDRSLLMKISWGWWASGKAELELDSQGSRRRAVRIWGTGAMLGTQSISQAQRLDNKGAGLEIDGWCVQRRRRPAGRSPPLPDTEQTMAVEPLNISLMENWMWPWCLGYRF